MSDQAHDAAPHQASHRTPDGTSEEGAGSSNRALVAQVVAVVVAFAGAGALGGYLWFRIWDPPPGVVYAQEWFPDPWSAGQQSVFTATVTFAGLGFGLSLLLGVLAALTSRGREVATLAAVAVAAALAGYLAYRLGVHLGPADAQARAADAADGTRFPGSLTLSGISPFLVWPLGGVLGLGATYFLSAGLGEAQRRDADDPMWLTRNPSG